MGTTRKRAPTWAVAVKITPRVRPGLRLWHLPDFITFIWKYVFSKELGCFYRFQKFFFMETYGLNIWIQLSNSNRFLWPLKVGGNLKGTINFIGKYKRNIYLLGRFYLIKNFQWSTLLWDFLFPNASYNNYSVKYWEPS